MKMKINEKILSIPPYISTSWDRVHSLYSEKTAGGNYTLSIHLDQGQIIHMELDSSLIDLAFSSHLRYLENKVQQKGNILSSLLAHLFHISPDMKEVMLTPSSFLISPETLEVALYHDPKRSTDPIDPDMLQRVSQVLRWTLNDDISSLSKAEDNCDCPHCQLMRYLEPSAYEEELCSNEDLQFREWHISKIGTQLYRVSNPLHVHEEYHVHLEEPLGCTCGESGCPHLIAVLQSDVF